MGPYIRERDELGWCHSYIISNHRNKLSHTCRFIRDESEDIWFKKTQFAYSGDSAEFIGRRVPNSWKDKKAQNVDGWVLALNDFKDFTVWDDNIALALHQTQSTKVRTHFSAE